MNTSFGETLRIAREAKGLTTSQIAAKTRMLVQIVEEMENEDFHRIAAPIYGRGFVKLYAECVDLDPLPLVKEFMDIYEGRRAPIVRTRDVPIQAQPPPPAPEPVPEPPPVVVQPPPAPEPEPIPEPPPVVVPPPPAPEPEPIPEPVPGPPPIVVPSPPSPAPVSPFTPEPVPEPIPEPPPVVRGLELFEAAAPRQQATQESAQSPSADKPPAANVADIFSDSPYLSTESSYGGEGPSAADRFKKSLSNVSHGVIQSVRDIPRSVWRITSLTIVAILLLALLAWGCIKLYQATSITPINLPPATQDTKDIKGTESPKDIKATKATDANKAPDATKDPKANKKDIKSKAATPPQKPNATQQPQPKPAKRLPLRSTGQKVPSLYAD